MQNIASAELCQGRLTFFIRYNPDSYVTEGVVERKSARENLLLAWLRQILQRPPLSHGDFTLTSSSAAVLYLFYDGFDASKQKWEVLVPPPPQIQDDLS